MTDRTPPRAPRAPGTARLARAFLLRALLLGLAWWVVAEGRADAWWFGVPATLGAALASLVLAPPTRPAPRPWPAARMFLWFLGRSLQGGVDVGLRALRPSLPIAPDFLRLRLRLADARARVLLIDVLSLMPGTLSAALDGDLLTLHVLDVRLPVERDLRRLEEHVSAVLATPLLAERPA